MSGDAGTPPVAPRGPQILALGPALLLTGRVIPSFAQYALTGEDNLVVAAIAQANGSWTLKGRFLDAASGKILPVLVSGSVMAGVQTQTLVPVTTGYLLNLGLSWTPAMSIPPAGAFCQVALARGTRLSSQTAVGLILQGYVYPFTEMGFPGSAFSTPGETPGWMRSVVATVPGAGHDVHEAVPTNAEWELLAMRWTFTSSAAVGNRAVALVVSDTSGTNVIQSGAEFWQTAGGSFAYDCYVTAERTIQPPPINLIQLTLPRDLHMQAGWTFGTLTYGMLAGDQYQNISYLVREHVALS